MNDFQEEGAAQTIAILRDEIITERGFTEEWRNQLLRARNRNTDLQRQLEAAAEEISEYRRILTGKTKRITKARQTIREISEFAGYEDDGGYVDRHELLAIIGSKS